MRENKTLFQSLPWAYEIQSSIIFISDLVLAPIRSQNKHMDVIGNTSLHYQRRIYEMSMKMFERESEGTEQHAEWLTNNQLNPWIFVLQKQAIAQPLNKYSLQRFMETQSLLQ